MAGILGPWLTGLLGWRGALLIAARRLPRLRADAAAAAARNSIPTACPAQSLPPVGLPHHHHGGDARRATCARLSFACFAFNGLQTVFTSYFVTYLVALGYGLAAAGLVFSIAMVIAVPGRILWGWFGSGHASTRVAVMGWLALGMAVSAGADGLLRRRLAGAADRTGRDRPAATAMSWHGVLLSEAARLAPRRAARRGDGRRAVLRPARRAAAAAGLFALLLTLTGSYGIGFIACGVPALWVGWELLRCRPPTPE